MDDRVFARLFAIQILLDEGFTVLEAADAAEGLDVLDRNDESMIRELDNIDGTSATKRSE